jgi:hypothetical protein
MRENLKAARMRDDEQTAALQAEKAKLEQANERIRCSSRRCTTG